MKLSAFLILLFPCGLLFGQGDSTRNNAFEIPLFKLESNTHTFHDKLEPKFFAGLTYERILNKWSLTATAEYGNNRINDYCGNCNDAYEGKGELIEFNIFLGYKFIINNRKPSNFKFFIGNDLYYSYANYNGNFTGGIYNGGQYEFENYLNSFGIQQKLGFDYYPFSKIKTLSTEYQNVAFGEGTIMPLVRLTTKTWINEFEYQLLWCLGPNILEG